MSQGNEATRSSPGMSLLSNPDLDPVPLSQRSWSLWNIASLWVGMSVCIPTYLLAAAMVGSGMNWWQSLLAWFFATGVSLLTYYQLMKSQRSE